jgi:hypothetical protein
VGKGEVCLQVPVFRFVFHKTDLHSSISLSLSPSPSPSRSL